jgi:hypothetical protein
MLAKENLMLLALVAAVFCAHLSYARVAQLVETGEPSVPEQVMQVPNPGPTCFLDTTWYPI